MVAIISLLTIDDFELLPGDMAENAHGSDARIANLPPDFSITAETLFQGL